MKLPKETNRYCPKCKKLTAHKISQVKGGRKRGALTHGARRFTRKTQGYGGFPRPKPEKSSRFGIKTTKKIALMYTCKTCKKSTLKKSGFRAKKIEWEAKQ
jgi:large subunit ribosomal protein L44e